MKTLVISILTFMSLSFANAATDDDDEGLIYKYRVTLTDKDTTEYSISKPEQFLSPKAIERRRRQGIDIDITDIPVCHKYLHKLASFKGIKILHTSKWNNSVLVQPLDTAYMNNIRKLPFVKDVCCVAASKANKAPEPGRKNKILQKEEKKDDKIMYGKGYGQIAMMHGVYLHSLGYRGEGMTIAVIDGGFNNADIIPALGNIKILGTHDFVNANDDMFAEHNHGMNVLSCMAANIPYIYIGTAPAASYWLLRSEDAHTEQPVEEDNFMAAVEFADSVGVDIINSSLGYTKFDNPKDKICYWELDGKTHPMSRVASMLASKGIIFCTSAGNEGNDTWKKISIPADASDILSVGAVDTFFENANFSSLGNTNDGRIKPDVCALGVRACVMDVTGHTTYSSGTSFASPILCGMVACLWQALPQLNAYQIMDIVRESGNNASHPDNVFGYGVPNMEKALELGKEKSKL